MCLGALAACSLAAFAIVPTLTVTDMLAAHERRLLREDGILAPARHAVTNGFGAVLMTGPGALSVGTYFIRLRDSDGWAEIRNGEGLLTSEIAPIRADAQNLIGERFGFIPGDDTPEELRLSHLVSQWEVVSPERAADLEAIDVMASAWRSARAAKGDIDAWMDANDNKYGRNACAIQKGVKYVYFHKRIRGFYDKREVPQTEW